MTRLSSLPENYLEVRCCCDPSLVLGYLPGPVPSRLAPGLRMRFPGPDRLELVVGRVGEERIDLEEGPGKTAFRERVTRRTTLAYKSDETPIEVLRRVPGFLEPR